MNPLRHFLRIGSHGGMSPLLEERACFLAVATGSYRMARDGLQRWGIAVGESTLHGHVDQAGRRARAMSQARVERALDLSTRPEVVAEASRELKGRRFSLVLMLDGWMARHRGVDWGMKPPGALGQRVDWREIKSAIVFRLADRGQNQSGRRILVEKYTVAHRGDPYELGRRLHAEALRRGLAQAEQVYVVADGGVWIWNIVEDRFSHAKGVLDFYHGAEHLWSVAHELYGEGPEAEAWVEPLLHQLRHGEEAGVVQEMEQLVDLFAEQPEPLKEVLNREANYFRQHRDHIHYQELEALGCPCGSGAMESTCAQLQRRFKQGGQFWSDEGFTNLLELELALRNGDWEAIWSRAA